MKKYKIAIVVGSLRKDSFNRKLANELIRIQPESLDMEIVEIKDVEFYNEDLDHGNPPTNWQIFRQAIKAVDGVLFLTPEYNRSIPGVLKNALDVGSRPYGDSAWEGKPVAVISTTPGPFGAMGANHALRQTMVFLNTPMMQQPEAYLANIHTSFEDDGKLTERTEKFLNNFLAVYTTWVEKHVD